LIKVADDLPQIRIDPFWATQAIFNLISNALKFTREGVPPEIEIASYHGEHGTGVRVLDRGCGVPSEYLENIFGLFKRAVGREIEGTGAGLAIVKEVASRHGGKAWGEQREGGGSIFTITFGA
jgi:signal transduction histidine kinase